MITSIRLDLLEILGSRYVIDHCIAALNKYRKDETFRFYITDAVKNINEILARAYGGTYTTVRYADMVKIEKRAEDTRSGDEIAIEVIKRAGLKAKGGGNHGNTV